MRFSAPTLLVHPMGFGSDFWLPQAGPNALTPDLPGYGDQTGPFTANTAINALIAIAREAANGAPIDVVGVSLGSRLAIHLAAQQPELVRSLAVTGLGPDSSRLTTFLQLALSRIMPAGALTQRSTRVTKAAVVETMRSLPDLAVRDALTHVKAPTLVWWGDRDRSAESASRAAAKTIPGARLEVVQGGDHLWIRDLPEQFEHRFSNWIAQFS